MKNPKKGMDEKMYDRGYKDAVAECARIANAEPGPGEPTPEERRLIESAGAVSVGLAAVLATKKNIARKILALMDKMDK